MKHSIPHPLGPEAAKRVVDRAFAEYGARYGSYEPKLSWTGDKRADVSFAAKGVRIEGTLSLQTNTIDLDLDVPFLLRVFQSKAVEVIDREVKKWIEKAKTGEL